MEVTVRLARKDDARTVAEYALKLFEQHREYDPERFVRLGNLEGAEWFYGSRNDTEDSAVLVAEIDNRVVGFAYMLYEKINYPDLLENALRLEDIYVDDSARGRGAGKALMRAAVEKAKQFGADKLVLTVAAKNAFAREFFSRNGLRETMVEMTLNLVQQE